MYTIDDPMFSLITRFIGYNQKFTLCNHAFIEKQLKAIQAHVETFPIEEKDLRAIEWIEKYACEYRERWEKEVIGKNFSSQRCSDCPLSDSNNLEHCQIHDQWLELLQNYSSNKINSKNYVKNTLKLLVQHKHELKMRSGMMREAG